MKILLYSEALSLIKTSGLGRAIKHQMAALSRAGVKFTTDVRDKDWDIVHINTLGIMSRLLAYRAKRAGRRVVYHAHSTQEDFKDSFTGSNLVLKLYKKWICFCYNSGDVIVTPTEYSKSLLEGYGLKRRVFAVSNGIDLSFYEPRAEDRREFREKYGYSEGDKVIMSVGLYFRRKGLLDFVELAGAMPDCRFIWFGKTPLFCVPREIRRAVRTRLPNLIFAGYVPSEELKKAYAGADIFLFPTHEETEGIVLLEALASRANVITRRIPVFGWLREGIDCYKADSVEEFRAAIRGVLSGELPSLRETGHAAVADKDIGRIGVKLAEVYSLTSGNPGK